MQTLTTKPQDFNSGFGHQLQFERRSVDTCKSYLEEAFGQITNIQCPEVQILATRIAGLITKANEISHAMEEAYNIND